MSLSVQNVLINSEVRHWVVDWITRICTSCLNVRQERLSFLFILSKRPFSVFFLHVFNMLLGRDNVFINSKVRYWVVNRIWRNIIIMFDVRFQRISLRFSLSKRPFTIFSFHVFDVLLSINYVLIDSKICYLIVNRVSNRIMPRISWIIFVLSFCFSLFNMSKSLFNFRI